MRSGWIPVWYHGSAHKGARSRSTACHRWDAGPARRSRRRRRPSWCSSRTPVAPSRRTRPTVSDEEQSESISRCRHLEPRVRRRAPTRGEQPPADARWRVDRRGLPGFKPSSRGSRQAHRRRVAPVPAPTLWVVRYPAIPITAAASTEARHRRQRPRRPSSPRGSVCAAPAAVSCPCDRADVLAERRGCHGHRCS